MDFTNAVVIMTSNLGAGKARRGVGFVPAEATPEDERMKAAAKAVFLPEFLNRIDEIVARLAADGFDEELGARPLQRHVRRTLEKALTEAIVSGRLAAGQHVQARLSGAGSVVLWVDDTPAQPAELVAAA